VESAALPCGTRDASRGRRTTVRGGKIRTVNLRHRIVHFSLVDVYFPDPKKLVLELHRDAEIEGKVIDFSDSGARKDAFAVIRVAGLSQPVVVPVDRLKVMPPAS
jgi:hypothetical protein